MKKSAMTQGESPSRLIDARIAELDDWRGKTLSHVRALIKQADPDMWFGAKSMYDNAGFKEVARRKPQRPIVRVRPA